MQRLKLILEKIAFCLISVSNYSCFDFFNSMLFISKVHFFIFILNLGKTRYSVEINLNLDTSHYDKDGRTLNDRLPPIVARELAVPENFIICRKAGIDWWSGRSEDDKILVRLLKVFEQEEKDKICDVINSSKFVTNINLGIGKYKDLADGKVTMKINSEPLVKVLTGRQSILWISSITFENIFCYFKLSITNLMILKYFRFL